MNDSSLNPFEIACRKVEPLKIYDSPSDQSEFCQAVINYARSELQSRGVELFSLGTEEDLSEYCQLCLKLHPGLDPVTALVVASHAIHWGTKLILKVRRRDV